MLTASLPQKNQTPSYCDRILVKASPFEAFRRVLHGPSHAITTSDHSPIGSSFVVEGIFHSERKETIELQFLELKVQLFGDRIEEAAGSIAEEATLSEERKDDEDEGGNEQKQKEPSANERDEPTERQQDRGQESARRIISNGERLYLSFCSREASSRVITDAGVELAVVEEEEGSRARKGARSLWWTEERLPNVHFPLSSAKVAPVVVSCHSAVAVGGADEEGEGAVAVTTVHVPLRDCRDETVEGAFTFAKPFSLFGVVVGRVEGLYTVQRKGH